MEQISEFVIQLISSAGVASAAALLIVWLTRLWLSEGIKNSIRTQYEEKLETHKAQLKAQSDVEIERLRSQLRDASMEHQIVFSRLHEKRATVIAETYSCLKELHVCLSEYVKIFEIAGGASKEERYGTLVEAHREFFESYSKRLIFFPEKTAKRLEEINQAMVQTGNEFRVIVEPGNSPDSIKVWREIELRVRNEVGEALLSLENEFRLLLGDRDQTHLRKPTPPTDEPV